MLGRRLLSVFASLSWGLLSAHGWYRDLRKKAPMVQMPPDEPVPVLIMAESRDEAEDIAELLGDEHVLVVYRPRTRYDRIRES